MKNVKFRLLFSLFHLQPNPNLTLTMFRVFFFQCRSRIKKHILSRIAERHQLAFIHKMHTRTQKFRTATSPHCPPNIYKAYDNIYKHRPKRSGKTGKKACSFLMKSRVCFSPYFSGGNFQKKLKKIFFI